MALTYFNSLKYIQGDLTKVTDERELWGDPRDLALIDLVDQ